ncbi:MAG: molecular chaperone GroEL [Sulfitobacter sp.]
MKDPVETFFAAWSVTDAPDRLAMIAATLADAPTYTDPRTPDPLTSAKEVADYVGMFIAAAPGAVARVAKTDTLHGMTRATVEFRMADGKTQHGQYFIEYADDKIARMAGFVGTGAPQ